MNEAAKKLLESSRTDIKSRVAERVLIDINKPQAIFRNAWNSLHIFSLMFLARPCLPCAIISSCALFGGHLNEQEKKNDNKIEGIPRLPPHS